MKIYLTDVEIQKVLNACTEYIEIMEQGEDTHDYTAYELETGLGSALRKLYKYRKGQNAYARYKTVSKCQTFDEWKNRKIEKEIER